MLLALFWFFSTSAIALGLNSWRAGRLHLQWSAESVQRPAGDWLPPVTLIVPVKGGEEGLRENLESLLAQDHPDFELLIVARTDGDPALVDLRNLPGARIVLAGEGPPNTGEKIVNLLAAVNQARPSSEVLAFADSDGRVERTWLRGLIAPLADPAIGAATGYRWYFPERGGFWPLARSAWNATIAGGFGPGPASFAWGGAMALRRETFEKCGVREFWIGAVSDDYRLSEAVRAAGLPIIFAPRAMVESPGECGGREFLEWAMRQLIITRVYRPELWWAGLAAHVVYGAAMLTGIILIAAGRWWAGPLLLVSVVPGMIRGSLRRRAAELMFPSRAAWLAKHGWAYFWLAPLVTWIWLYTFLASALRRRIAWRGRVYDLLSPSETRIVDRSGRG